MTLAWFVLGIGIILIVLSAFGVAFPIVDIFKLGVAFCFASHFVPARSLS